MARSGKRWVRLLRLLVVCVAVLAARPALAETALATHDAVVLVVQAREEIELLDRGAAVVGAKLPRPSGAAAAHRPPTGTRAPSETPRAPGTPRYLLCSALLL